MTQPKLTEVLLYARWRGWQRWALWSVCACVLFSLVVLRVETDAEMAIASFALLPVLTIAWLVGKTDGMFAALLAAGVWTIGDLASGTQFSAPWVPWANAIARLTTYSLVAVLTAQVRLQFARERENATMDALTGLRNRRAFLEAGAIEVERARRRARPLAVVFLDLDNFKQLNDARGHAAGDAALCSTAAALVDALRSSDPVARLGGDEFAVLLPETSFDEAKEVGRKLSAAMKEALRPFAPVGASVGVAWFQAADRTFVEMLEAADDLMYEAKESPGGGVFLRDFATGGTTGADAE